MSTEDNKKLIVKSYDFLNQKKLSLEEFLDPGFVFHDPSMPEVNDFASVRQLLAAGYEALPDMYSTIEDLVAEGDKVVCRYSSRATQERDFRGMPATGKQATLTGVAIYRILGGKIREEWNFATRAAPK